MADEELTIEEKIENILFGWVRDLELEPALPVAWPNDDFPGVDDADHPVEKPARYLEVKHFRNSNGRLFVKGTAPHLRQGILQIAVVAPLNEGPSFVTRLAGIIAAQLPADHVGFDGETKVRVQSAPDVGNAGKTNGDASWGVLLSVRYESLI